MALAEEHPILPAPPDSSGGATLPIVICAIGDQRYGLPVDLVREVVPLPALLELAGAAAGGYPLGVGLLNRRGSYIPVLDGRSILGQPSQATLDSHVLLVGPEQPEVGLLVDQVTAVQHISASQLTGLDRRSAGAFLEGVVSTPDGPVLLLHVPALLAMAPAISQTGRR
jgi:purine-binding chemotaxis protein CheW